MKIPLGVVLIIAAVLIALISGCISFFPLYNEAKNSSMTIAGQYAGEVSRKVLKYVSEYLSSAVYYTSAIRRAFRLGAMDRRSNESIVEWMCDFVQPTNFSYIVYYDDLTGFLFGRLNTMNISVPMKANNTVVSFYDGHRQIADYWYVPNDNVTFDRPPDIRQGSTFNHTARPYYAPMHSSFTWVTPFVDYGKAFADFGIGAPLINKTTGATYGIHGTFFRTIAIIEYFKGLQVAKTGQAFLIDVATKSYIGGTMADATVKTINGAVFLTLASDIRDPVAQMALDGIGNSLYECRSSCAFSVGSGNDLLFVQVASLIDEYGLDLRIVIAIPSADFLADIRSGMTIGLGAAGGAIAGFLIITAVLLQMLLRPLKRLEKRLYASATLEDEEAHESHSFLSEICNIEEAYAKLQAELKKVKSFLPQSVLRQLEQSNSSDDEGEQNQKAAVASTPTQSDSKPTEAKREPDDSLGFPNVLTIAATANEEKQNPGGAFGEAHHDSPDQLRGSFEVKKAENSQSNLQASTGVEGANQSSGSNSMDSHTPVGANGGPKEKRKPRLTHVPPGTRQLNLESALHSRRVTVVMANLSSFHKALELTGPVELQHLHAKVVSTMLDFVNQSKGVVDSFHGDRFQISFNASTTCQGHGTRAATMVLNVTASLTAAAVKGFTGIRFGAATGNALCGNFGAEGMKRFSVVGAVVNHSFALMQQSKLENVSNLVSGSSFELMTNDFLLQHMNFVMLPQASSGGLISTIIERRSNGLLPPSNLERLTTRAVSTEVTEKVNDAFEAFSRGDIGKAKELAQQLPREQSAAIQRSIRSVGEFRSTVYSR